MKQLALCITVLAFLVGCGSIGQLQDSKVDVVEHKVQIEVISGENVDKVVVKDETNKVLKSMEVRKAGYELSILSAVYDNKLYIKLFSGLSVADVTRAWNDLIVAENEYDITEVNLFIDSPGGDAFSGLALADQIEKYQVKNSWKFIAHGTGIIASAAVPVFAVCDETHATSSTIFMVHEAALWKWPGRESASTIRAQGRLMGLLQYLYLTKMVKNSNLDFDAWVLLEAKTSWFDVHKAKEMGILDHIDGIIVDPYNSNFNN